MSRQYRSRFLTTTPEQAGDAQRIKAELPRERHFKRPIVTVIEPAKPSGVPKDYHQQYAAKRGGGGLSRIAKARVAQQGFAQIVGAEIYLARMQAFFGFLYDKRSVGIDWRGCRSFLHCSRMPQNLC